MNLIKSCLLFLIIIFVISSCSVNEYTSDDKTQDPYLSYKKIFIIPVLKIYKKSNGEFVIDYYNFSGNLICHTEKMPNGTRQVLYSGGTNNILEIREDNTVSISEEDGAGLHQYVVNLFGLAVELDSSSGTKDFYLRFLDANTGQYAHSAQIICNCQVKFPTLWKIVFPSDWKIEFPTCYGL